VIRPWEHGTIVRATRYPTYYDFNLVRVDEEPGLSVAELTAVAHEALAGLDHRRFDFDVIEPADARRAEFEAAGWKTARLVWMLHESEPPPGPEIEVEEVPYDEVHALRVAWHEEDFPEVNPTSYHRAAREVAMRRGAQVLTVRGDDGAPVAFAQLERDGGSAEITQVYVHPDHRGGGRGTAMTRAAIEAAAHAGAGSHDGDLWIVADDEDRPKELYARLGFRPVWKWMEVTLWPK
jgi:ribosomal protein S18 acetylase RimI-like enzyme